MITIVLSLKRATRFSKYQYMMKEDKTFEASCRYTYGVLLRKISMRIGGKQYQLKQKNFFKKIINMLPFLWYRGYPNYELSIDRKVVGATKMHFFKRVWLLNCNGNEYSFQLDSGNYIHVFKNNSNVATIHKDPKSFNEVHNYDIDVKDDNDKEVILIIAVFSDVMFFPNRLSYSGWKFEKTL